MAVLSFTSLVIRECLATSYFVWDEEFYKEIDGVAISAARIKA